MTFPRSHDKTAMFQNGRENLREIGNGSLAFLYFSLSLSFFFFGWWWGVCWSLGDMQMLLR